MILSKEEHGAIRAGKVTGSVADIIDSGSNKACDTLIKSLWAGDDGSFAKESTGARAFGHANEGAGVAKFWDRHPEFEPTGDNWFDYDGIIPELVGYVGVSPDDMLKVSGVLRSGLEIKSPTDPEHMRYHVTPPGHSPRWNPHYAQCQHGMLVTGVREWWQVTHFGELYVEQLIQWDDAWMSQYIKKLKHFIGMMNFGKGARRKLRMGDLDVS